MSEIADGGEGQQQETQVEAETVESLQAKLTKYKEIASTQEKRAKENASAAKRLAEIEESQKSDAEKAADRITKAEAEAASVPAKVCDALRKYFVDSGAIDAERAELYLTAAEPELFLKQFSGLVGESDKRKKNVVPREGTNPVNANSELRDFTRDLFGQNN